MIRRAPRLHNSMLMSSAMRRIAIALLLIAGLWLAVAWALQ